MRFLRPTFAPFFPHLHDQFFHDYDHVPYLLNQFIGRKMSVGGIWSTALVSSVGHMMMDGYGHRVSVIVMHTNCKGRVWA